MARTSRIALGLMAIATLGLTPARAHALCGGNNFQTCATVAINAVYNAQTQRYTITMTVTNLSGTNGTWAGTVFTQIGLQALPSAAQYVANSGSVSGGGSAVQWTFGNGPNGLNGAGITGVVMGVDANGNNGLTVAHGATVFTFQISGVAANYVFNDWAIHGQVGPNGCSTKLVVTNDSPNAGPYDPDCEFEPPGGGGGSSVTPEPASLVLISTGLLGFAGTGFSRRRRKH